MSNILPSDLIQLEHSSQTVNCWTGELRLVESALSDLLPDIPPPPPSHKNDIFNSQVHWWQIRAKELHFFNNIFVTELWLERSYFYCLKTKNILLLLNILFDDYGIEIAWHWHRLMAWILCLKIHIHSFIDIRIRSFIVFFLDWFEQSQPYRSELETTLM